MCFLKDFIRNPITIWFSRVLKAKRLEKKYQKYNLKIGYMCTVNNCSFGFFNTIYDFVSLNNVQLGDFTYIANGTSISKTSIGKFCSIGPGCKVGLGKHPTRDFVSTHPVFFSDLKQSQISFSDKKYLNEFSDIKIGNDVWFGANVIVVDGVNISDGVIVAAGSVVTKDIPPYAIVGGVPAKIIRYRFNQNEINELLCSKWWDNDFSFLKKNFKYFHNIHDYVKFINKN